MNNNKQLILTCIDGSSVSEAVCDYAAWLSLSTRAPLKLLHTIEHRINPAVTDYSGAIGLGSQDELLKELTEIEQKHGQLLIKKGQLMLNAAKQRLLDSGVNNPQILQQHGNLVDSLIELEDNIRVLVVGIRGEAHEQENKGIGTQLESIIRSLHRPILVVNQKFTTPENILLAYDGSESCNKAVSMIASSPVFKTSTCHIAHVGNQGQPLLDSAAQQLTTAGLKVVTQQLQGRIDSALAEYQSDNNIQMIVMGAFSHHKLRDFLLGSFTFKMLTRTQCPLLLLR